MSKPCIITIWFGVPGAGKTTLVAYNSKKAMKKNIDVFSNVPIINTYKVCKDDLGKYEINDCLLEIDEASIEYNNRSYKTMSKETIEFYKLHRHRNIQIDVYSQAFDDMDLTLRRLAGCYKIVKKSIFPYCITTRSIGRHITIDEKEQIIDGYYWKPLSRRWIFSPPLWKMFNSYDAPVLEPKTFEKWNNKEVIANYNGTKEERYDRFVAKLFAPKVTSLHIRKHAPKGVSGAFEQSSKKKGLFKL